MTNQRTSTPVAMLLFGMAAGAAGALMLAPRSGRETRVKLKEAGKKWQDNALDASDKATDKVKLGIQKASTKLNTKADEAVEKIEATSSKAKQKFNSTDVATPYTDITEDIV